MKIVLSLTLILALTALLPATSQAANAATIDLQVSAAAENLFANNSSALALARRAKAVLIFPKVLKAGLIFGGQYGEGALRERGRTMGYYNTAAASYGFQAGATEFGYALFFMDDEALSYLQKSRGWSIGAGPTVVIIDEGVSKSLDTNSIHKGVYAYCFNHKGLMAGLSLQGSKISRIYR